MKLAVHPFAKSIPTMSADEFAALVEDIKANGLREPIWLYQGKILDGRHRYNACLKLGIDPTTVNYALSDDKARRFVISMNVHRRHLAMKQKRAIIAAELKRDPAQSDRSIAKKAKVSKTTVTKARSDAEEKGDVVKVTTSTDTLGRKQPRKRKKSTESTGRKARGRKPKETAPDEPLSPCDQERCPLCVHGQRLTCGCPLEDAE